MGGAGGGSPAPPVHLAQSSPRCATASNPNALNCRAVCYRIHRSVSGASSASLFPPLAALSFGTLFASLLRLASSPIWLNRRITRCCSPNALNCRAAALSLASLVSGASFASLHPPQAALSFGTCFASLFHTALFCHWQRRCSRATGGASATEPFKGKAPNIGAPPMILLYPFEIAYYKMISCYNTITRWYHHETQTKQNPGEL